MVKAEFFKVQTETSDAYPLNEHLKALESDVFKFFWIIFWWDKLKLQILVAQPGQAVLMDLFRILVTGFEDTLKASELEQVKTNRNKS